MNEMDGTKIVNFEYCNTCEYKDTPEDENPCHECLNEPVNLYSEKPVNYKEKE